MTQPSYTITADDLGLFTDLYELTMMQSYFDAGVNDEAVFSLFARRLPEERSYLVACGLADALDYLESVRFSPDAIAYLKSLGLFSDAFLDWLSAFRFEGDVYAVPEGTPVFADEPLLEVAAPVAQAQLAETFLMNQIHLQTLLATKAARMVEAAQGRKVIDFGSRRGHGLDAALKGARAFHIAGIDATSNVLAGARYGVPVAGTMAHSYIEAFESEADAFRTFVRSYPETILLVDTYDTLAGVKTVIALAGELGEEFRVSGIRLDSGDLGALAREARAMLDAAGLKDVSIFASGGLDEHRIAALLEKDAPIDGFGVGTAMSVSEDDPALDIVYKLSAYAGEGRLKLSQDKATLPGRKQVFRTCANGRYSGDVIARAEEDLAGAPLLVPVMKDGRRIGPEKPLAGIREHARAEREALPAGLRALMPAAKPYPVTVSEALKAYTEKVARRFR